MGRGDDVNVASGANDARVASGVRETVALSDTDGDTPVERLAVVGVETPLSNGESELLGVALGETDGDAPKERLAVGVEPPEGLTLLDGVGEPLAVPVADGVSDDDGLAP